MRLSFQTTLVSCFVAYIVQAIVNNFIPLLFVTFQTTYGIPLGQITLLIALNFLFQLAVDAVAMLFVDRIGYRISVVMADFFAAAGLILLPILPQVMDPFAGLLIAVLLYALGGGLIEVLISPIVQSCPTENKEKAMSLLHSFYCWGFVLVVLVSTLFFTFVGVQWWPVLAVLWALVPLGNAFVFMKVPLAPLIPENETGMSFKALFANVGFWAFMIMMVCSGASEIAVSQWASAFAEEGLDLTKTAGDLAGPMTFAVLMGLSRAFYGKYGHRINLNRFMLGSALLCVGAYVLISLAPVPWLSLVGCALCGLSVGIMWPGTLSQAAAALPLGGTALFAMLALGGDLGASVGPGLVGLVSSLTGGDMRIGILVGTVFPLALFVCLAVRSVRKRP